MRDKLRETPHSRLPVARGSVDDIVGVVQARDIVAALFRGDVIDLDDVKLDGGYKIADVRDVVNGKIDEHNVATVYVTM